MYYDEREPVPPVPAREEEQEFEQVEQGRRLEVEQLPPVVVDGDDRAGGSLEMQEQQEVLEQQHEECRNHEEEQLVVDGGDGAGGLDLCLREWRDQHLLPPHPTLSSCPGFTNTNFLMQIIDFKTDVNGKHTGEVTLTDSEYTVSAMLGTVGAGRQRFISLLQNHKFGIYSLVRVRETVGPPEDLVIVSFPLVFTHVKIVL